MNQRFATTLLVVATLIGIACVDMSAPSGAASISVLQLPSPAVVVGDSMRDSLGVAKPITVIVYDGNGNPISDATVQVFVTDSAAAAHLSASNVLVGDKIGSARLLGQVAGLQTPVATVPVTHRPAKLVARTVRDSARFGTQADSALSLGFGTAGVVVRSDADSASQSIVVRFTLVSAPATRAGVTSPAVFLADDQNARSTVDTTDAAGTASRRVVVIGGFLADRDLLLGNKKDSAVVEARVTYRGVPLANSPLRIVVPILAK